MRLDEYLDKVAQCPCVLHWKKLGGLIYGVELHHPTVPRNEWLVVPLCPLCHRGPTGVHGLHRRGFERMYKADDYTLLGWTNEAIARFT